VRPPCKQSLKKAILKRAVLARCAETRNFFFFNGLKAAFEIINVLELPLCTKASIICPAVTELGRMMDRSMAH